MPIGCQSGLAWHGSANHGLNYSRLDLEKPDLFFLNFHSLSSRVQVAEKKGGGVGRDSLCVLPIIPVHKSG